ncbi:hypothetical protein JMJ77_0008905, partial [Colletotrichum scovillei]
MRVRFGHCSRMSFNTKLPRFRLQDFPCNG